MEDSTRLMITAKEKHRAKQQRMSVRELRRQNNLDRLVREAKEGSMGIKIDSIEGCRMGYTNIPNPHIKSLGETAISQTIPTEPDFDSYLMGGYVKDRQQEAREE